jgi:hypothetical protein
MAERFQAPNIHPHIHLHLKRDNNAHVMAAAIHLNIGTI